LVWIPKYRKRVLRGKIAVRLKRLLYEACKLNRWWIGEISIQEDHVHVMIQIKPSDSIGHVVQVQGRHEQGHTERVSGAGGVSLGR
jgi:putative transposase